MGRWSVIDRFSEKYSAQSQYHYALNNPTHFIDINGDSTGTYGLFNKEMAGTLGYDKNGLDLYQWDQFSKGVYEVSGIKLHMPTNDGENLKIASVDKSVGAKTARMLFKSTFNDSKDQVDIHFKSAEFERVSNFESTVKFSENGSISLEDKKVNLNLSAISGIKTNNVDKKTIGVGMILAHEISHKFIAKNDDISADNPKGSTVDFVNIMRKEMNLPQRQHYLPKEIGWPNTKYVVEFDGGSVILPK